MTPAILETPGITKLEEHAGGPDALQDAVMRAIQTVSGDEPPKGSAMRGPRLDPKPRRSKSRRDKSRAKRKARR